MLLVCDHCDTAQKRGKILHGVAPHCVRCDHELYIPKAPRTDKMLALSLTGLIAFTLSNVYPVVSLSAHGQERSATLLAAVGAAADQDAIVVAVIAALAAFAVPLTELCLYVWILMALREGRNPASFRTAIHALRGIRHWSIVEVFLLAVVVSAVKLGDVATVTPGVGVFALFALVVCIAALRTFDLRDLWAQTSEPAA